MKRYYRATLYDHTKSAKEAVLWRATGDSMAYIRQRIVRDIEVFTAENASLRFESWEDYGGTYQERDTHG